MCQLQRNNAVFTVGINWTGTTYLHRLMAQDARFWPLRAYEYVEPVMGGGDYASLLAGTPEDPRRALAADVFRASGIIDSFRRDSPHRHRRAGGGHSDPPALLQSLDVRHPASNPDLRALARSEQAPYCHIAYMVIHTRPHRTLITGRKRLIRSMRPVIMTRSTTAPDTSRCATPNRARPPRGVPQPRFGRRGRPPRALGRSPSQPS